MAFACVLIDHLPVKAEVSRAGTLGERPLIIYESSGSRRTVLDASPQAKGVRAGMPLSEGLSECKDSVLVEADQVYYRSVFDGLLTAIETIGADVEEEKLGLAYVKLSGLELLYGGEDALVQALLRTVPAHFSPIVGVGPNKFVASVAAYGAKPGVPSRAPGDAASFLAPLPVELLPVLWKTIAKLKSFALCTLGQIAGMPVGAMQAQFGPEGKRMWEMANGIDPRPLLPRQHQETVEASLTFPDPIGTLGIVLTGVESLLARAFAQPAMHGRFARICSLEGSVFRAPTWHKRMVFKEPIGDKAKAIALLRPALENSPPPGAVEDLRLTLAGLTGEGGRQESLFSDVRRQDNLKEAMRQLRARLGVQPPIYHVREVEPWSRLPERRQALVPYAP